MKFTATPDTLSEILEWLEEELKSRSSESLLLACEEAIVNIVHHGYGDLPGFLDISINKKDSEVHVVMIDTAPAFNPLEKEAPVDPSLPLEKRHEGGLGIILMKKYTDALFYERVNGKNILTLVKKI
ncbi:MAG TPA: ATP-binding protein [Chlamydiales bacterium]|nr:ATP-binding protein [Chlamydiales bacterium]